MIQQFADAIRAMGKGKEEHEIVALAVESLEYFEEYQGREGVELLKSLIPKIQSLAEKYDRR